MRFPPLILCVGLLSVSSSLTAQKAVPKPEKRTVIGDVEIVGYERAASKVDLSKVTITGAKTLITVPDKKSGSVLRLHADEIEARGEGKDAFAYTELRGNLRYTLTQKTKTGERIVEGTAGQGNFRRTAQVLTLEGGVQAALTDAERLAVPASLRARKMTVEFGKAPYTYRLEGDPATTELRFTPKENAPDPKKPAKGKPNLTGTVQIFGFTKGTYQTGVKATFTGADTTLQLKDAERKTFGQLKAREVEADFTEEKNELKAATADGDVHFRIERPGLDKNVLETVEGTCEKAVYSDSDAVFTLTGAVAADLTAPATLLGPGRLRVDRVTIATLKPYRYTVTSSAENALLRFTPLPPKKPEPMPQPAVQTDVPKTVPRFVFGTIEITKFESGTFETGKQGTFLGNRIVFRSVDRDSQTSAMILARKITADLANDRDLTQAVAEGDVEYNIKQPSSLPKLTQGVDGRATQVTYKNSLESRTIELIGPLRAVITDPVNLAGPGVITGLVGDTLLLDLTGKVYEFDLISAKNTGTIVFVPRFEEKEDDKKKKRAGP